MTNIEKTIEANTIYQRKSREQNRSTKIENELERKSCQIFLPVEPKKQCMDVNGSLGLVGDINKIIN